MTNGEKIEEIFPNVEISPNPYSPSVDICIGGIMMMRIDRNWWNAEYKEPTTKNNIRDCKSCVYSKDGKCAGTEECHLCMWENQYTPTTKNDLGVDCISREQVRKAIIDHQYSNDFCEEHNIDHSINTSMALIALSDLPSVTLQESRRGHWVHGEYCSECGWNIPAYIIARKWQKYMDTTYCPSCGEKMFELQESEGK